MQNLAPSDDNNKLLRDIIVSYSEDGRRSVKCFCGEYCDSSILPHISRDHPEVWKEWRQDFVESYNQGLSYKRIMDKYRDKNGRLLFSWTVIEKNLKIMFETGQALILPRRKTKIETWRPDHFELEKTTLWSFPRRGSWAVHQSDYRGNWPPQLPRNLILKYTEEGELVLDPFSGGGTSLIEAWLEGRRSVGIDINPIAEQITRQRIEEMRLQSEQTHSANLRRDCEPIIIREDSRNIRTIMKNLNVGECSVDLLLIHAPYLNVLKYTEFENGDLSHLRDVASFCEEIQSIARQCYTLLGHKKKCAVLIGDVRKNGRMVPLGFRVMECFLREKYELLNIIIKSQHQDKSTEFYFKGGLVDYLMAHEYLFILQKQ